MNEEALRNAQAQARYQQLQAYTSNHDAAAAGRPTTHITSGGGIVETPAPLQQAYNQQAHTQQAYTTAQQAAVKNHPELAQAGSPMNKAFLDIVKQNGGREALMQNPALIDQYANQARQQSNPGNSAVAAAGAPRQAVPPSADPNSHGEEPSPYQDYPATSGTVAETQPEQQADYGEEPVDNQEAGAPTVGLDPSQTYDRVNPDLGYDKIGGYKIDPSRPYVGNSATEEDLASFPISLDDWMMGGGALSFQDRPTGAARPQPVPNKPSIPAKPILPKQQIKMPKKKVSMLPTGVDMTNLAGNMPIGPAIAPKLAALLEEKRELMAINQQLKKQANIAYSPEEIDLYTSSRENFIKAATIEAYAIWEGIENELRKQGANDDFIMGMIKESADNQLQNIQIEHVMPGLLAGMSGLERTFALPIINEHINRHAQAKRSIGQPVTFSDFDPSGIAAKLDALNQGSGKKFLDAFSDKGPEAITKLNSYASLPNNPAPATAGTPRGVGVVSPPPADRPGAAAPAANPNHEIFPGISNKLTGGLGGALVSALLGSSMGLEGPAAWMMPILGGLAGYHYLPKLMDQWKGTPGKGENSLFEAAKRFNKGEVAPAGVSKPPALLSADDKSSLLGLPNKSLLNIANAGVNPINNELGKPSGLGMPNTSLGKPFDLGMPKPDSAGTSLLNSATKANLTPNIIPVSPAGAAL